MLPHQAKSEPLFVFIVLAIACQPRLALRGLGLQLGKVRPQLLVLALGDVEVRVGEGLVHIVALVQLHHEAALRGTYKVAVLLFLSAQDSWLEVGSCVEMYANRLPLTSNTGILNQIRNRLRDSPTNHKGKKMHHAGLQQDLGWLA